MSDKPSNVIEALVAVSRDVDAIAKEKTANAGGSFKYRGIEDVLSACHDPFIRYGVVVVPQVTKAEMIKHEVTRSSGKVGFDFEAQMTVNYRIYGPGGPGDFIDAPIFATGMDSSDKGTGKAMSYAYKQLMFQLLCIPTDAAEDNEASHRTLERPVVPEDYFGWNSQTAHDAWWDVQKARLKALNNVSRDLAVMKLIEAGLFGTDRIPKLPFHQLRRGEIEGVINGAEKVATGPTSQAVEVMMLATGLDDPLNLPDGVEIAPWQWELAEVTDLDAHDWKPTAKDAGLRQVDLLDMAQGLAKELGEDEPDRITAIHGNVATELRAKLLAGVAPF
jgi:hypothetical protein